MCSLYETRKLGSVEYDLSHLQQWLHVGLISGTTTADDSKTGARAKGVQDNTGSGFADIANRWQAYDPGDLARMLEDSERRLTSHSARIRSLLDAVMTPQRRQSLQAILTQPLWRKLTLDPVRVGEGPSEIGLHIRAERGASD
jgi:hypothetical protein